MPLTVCRNSKNFGFYDTSKMTSFEPEMYHLLLLVQRFSSPDFFVTSNCLRLPKFGTQLPTNVLQTRFSYFFEFRIFSIFFEFLKFKLDLVVFRLYGRYKRFQIDFQPTFNYRSAFIFGTGLLCNDDYWFQLQIFGISIFLIDYRCLKSRT